MPDGCAGRPVEEPLTGEATMGRGSGKQGGQQGGTGGQDRGGSQPKYSPNDDRAIVKNSTSDAYDADKANRAGQAGGK